MFSKGARVSFDLVFIPSAASDRNPGVRLFHPAKFGFIGIENEIAEK